MLPALKSNGLSLADVLPSSLLAISGEPNALGLKPVDRVIVVLIDGLGAQPLAARSGHARTLVGAMTKKSVIESGFPTTTAAALATLTTGTAPGQHGLVGYSVLDTVNDRVIKQLSGWDSLLDPLEWQPQATVFEQAAARSVPSVAIGPDRYKGTGFTAGVLRGAEYRSANSIADRVNAAISWLTETSTGLAYLYIPEIDMTGHSSGSESIEWIHKLEIVDAAIRDLTAALGPRDGLIATADHGVLDVPDHAHIFVDSDPRLLDGVRFLAGEPRCVQVHFEKDASDAVRSRTIEAWRAAHSANAWIATRDEAIEAGWFGEVRTEVAPRIGDLLIAARKVVAFYDSRQIKPQSHGMIGQHGSWSDAELRVPVLRFGAFAT